MNSFTSNFKLLWGLTTAAALLVMFNLLLSIAPPQVTSFHNQWVKNMSVAERFIYQDTSPDVVIVGSSMAARLTANRIDPGAFNLSFSSSGSTTGLEIVERSGHYPKLLLVEANIIEKEVDQKMIDSLFNPVLWRLKKVALFLRFQYQPANILMTWVTGKFGSASHDNDDKPSEIVLKTETARRVRNNADDSFIREFDLSPLQETVARLSGHGTKVVFFRMPIAPEILETPQYQLRDKRMQGEFSDYVNLELSADESRLYQTKDGVHLNRPSAEAYSGVLSKYVEQLLAD